MTGEMRRRLEEQVLAHRETRPDDGTAEFARSSKRKEPYISRMRALDKELDSISLLDIGMFMQTFMLAAKDVGSTPAPRALGTYSGARPGGFYRSRTTNTSSPAWRWAMPKRTIPRMA